MGVCCSWTTTRYLSRCWDARSPVVDSRWNRHAILVERLKLRNPGIRIVVLTGFASVATAVEAIKLDAIHYLTKPADADEVVVAFGRDQGDAGAPVKTLPLSVDRLEWEHIQKVLTENTGNVSATARALNMHRRTLQRKLGEKPARD